MMYMPKKSDVFHMDYISQDLSWKFHYKLSLEYFISHRVCTAVGNDPFGKIKM